MTYWEAILKDNTICSEKDSNWSNIKKNIKQLYFVHNHKKISLPENMDEYIQAKTASATIGSSEINIESRYIGTKIGNNIIKIRINENTQNISVEIE